MDYVARLQSPGGNYPPSLGEDGHLLVHWCHGAPGVVYMLLQAYRVGGGGIQEELGEEEELGRRRGIGGGQEELGEEEIDT